MYNIAIIEDERNAAQLIRSYLDEYSKSSGEQFTVYEFSNAVRFLENYTAKYDIVFMDIELPDMNGMEASRRLRMMDKDVILIFVTNMAQCAVSGYEVEAFSFIVKPATYNNFVMKLERALTRLKNSGDSAVYIRNKTFSKRVNTSDLKYVEIRSHNVIWHTVHGDINSTGTLKSIQAQLGSNFACCNQCYLVNLKFCSEVSGDCVKVGDETLHISRPKRAEFVRALNLYINGEN